MNRYQLHAFGNVGLTDRAKRPWARRVAEHFVAVFREDAATASSGSSMFWCYSSFMVQVSRRYRVPTTGDSAASGSYGNVPLAQSGQRHHGQRHPGHHHHHHHGHHHNHQPHRQHIQHSQHSGGSASASHQAWQRGGGGSHSQAGQRHAWQPHAGCTLPVNPTLADVDALVLHIARSHLAAAEATRSGKPVLHRRTPHHHRGGSMHVVDDHAA